MVSTSMYEVASRFLGIKEIDGRDDHPLIQWAFILCGMSPSTPDEVAWCSAFLQVPTHALGLPRSKSARARSWLGVGTPVPNVEACVVDSDVVILKRGPSPQPGPETMNAPGHVGLFAGHSSGRVLLLGGNQGNSVSIAPFPITDVIGIRRLHR